MKVVKNMCDRCGQEYGQKDLDEAYKKNNGTIYTLHRKSPLELGISGAVILDLCPVCEQGLAEFFTNYPKKDKK